MNNTSSPTSAPRSRGYGRRLEQTGLPDELNSWVAEFDRYRWQVVGLAGATRREYRFFVLRLLAQYCPVTDHGRWTPRAEWLTAFVCQEATRLHGHSRKNALWA
ncbi:hypothetical protein H0X91_33550 [Burkholderia sp. 9777_1386]|uniref:hypothetical protein n=1 Tax=Burkholderia sp. 9777_1386 TaxID=2751183 RepID=UPI0018C36A8A|nr:hypothetical protein [Burkholderia sp. 9777_1386]MBG0874907.1 hypothetical protein [Burkholderia sp. 9777_1386]